MKIKMRTTAASPSGVLHAGHAYDLPRAEARVFLEHGCAALLEPEEKAELKIEEKAVVKAKETR
jgi:hypothetical protein